MRKVTLITNKGSKGSFRYQHIKWILLHLQYQVDVIDNDYFQLHKEIDQELLVRNPSLLDQENNLIQGEKAIITWAVLDSTKNLDNSQAPSKERTLLGYSTADVLQVESLFEILTEIERFAYDCILYTNLDISFPIPKQSNFTPNKSQKGNYFFNKYFKPRCYLKIESLKNFLGPKKYLVGYLTIADFKLANIIELFGKMSSKYCLVNPFGNFHCQDYQNLGMKTPRDQEDMELIQQIRNEFYGIEDDNISLLSKRELINRDQDDYYIKDPFQNLRMVRGRIKSLSTLADYFQEHNILEKQWVSEKDIDKMADLGRYVSNNFQL